MSLYLTQEFSAWGLTLLLILAACAYAIGLMLLTPLLYGVDRLSLNNEVAGFKFAVIGVFYAVLLAFVVVAVWENFRDTEGTVRNEAKAAVDLHRVASVLPGPVSADIRRDVITYVKDVRGDEWAKMAVGESSDVVTKDLDRLTKTVFAFNPGTTQEMVLYQTALRLLAQLTDNRNERLDSADGSVPTVLWFVLIAGGLITLGYPAFFGSTNLAAQVLMTASLAILVAIALLLSIVFDRPFTGDVTVSATPFERALAEMPAASSSP
ncbi:MAG TPA: hypothetical protein VFQ29_02015 [Methyloceanibacter sp.]|jgi:hypothetical protein|nr:hypothetical protein [Methyloceanibacter sp.]